MSTIIPNPPKIDIDLTDAQLTGQSGWALLSHAARRLGLLKGLGRAICIKRRDRGASDAEMLWSLIASLAAGNGARSDVDALRADAVGCRLLGLRRAPSSRRLGEHLSRFGAAEVEALRGLVGTLTRRLVPAVVQHEVRRCGYVPVFIDGSAIKVDGALFEGRAVATTARCNTGCTVCLSAACGPVAGCIRAVSMSPVDGASNWSGTWRRH